MSPASTVSLAQQNRPILLVDDEPDAVLLTRLSLARARIPNPLLIRENGVQAIAYLREVLEGKAVLPVLTLLDLRLPLTNGFEVLSWIAQHQELSRLFVAVQSTSTSAEDMERAHVLGAKSYIPKYPTPTELSDVLAAAERLEAAES